MNPLDSSLTEDFARCPACAQPIDYCQGHGEIGDPVGFAVLEGHEENIHDHCHPLGCPDRADVPPKGHGMPATATCPECARIFDMATELDAAEWHYGHDCESN